MDKRKIVMNEKEYDAVCVAIDQIEADYEGADKEPRKLIQPTLNELYNLRAKFVLCPRPR